MRLHLIVCCQQQNSQALCWRPGNDSVINIIQSTHVGGLMSFLSNTVNSPQLPKLLYPGASLYQKEMKINSGILLEVIGQSVSIFYA